MENQDIQQQLDQLERPDGTYDENQIQVLEGLEAVRKRPGMYIGSTDERGLHHLVYEIVDNAVDEALAGFCNEIIITLHKDGSCSVQDNGRGFPVGIHPKIGRPAVEVCLTILHAGGKFGGGGYKVSGGLHGVGASVVNALSKHLQVNVYQDGKIYQQEYERGKVLYDLKVIGETDRTGTTIRFWPDVKDESDPEGIFETGDFQYDTLKTRFREMAFLNRGIRIVFRDERPEEAKENVFHYEGGIQRVRQVHQQEQRGALPGTDLHRAALSARQASRWRCSTTTPIPRISLRSSTTSIRRTAARIWRASTWR